ncbi:MAG: hypothetical protein KDB23_29410 [Planctomycetales bacterium]|nr:hypothetical protein [Planctomycetales bacterium]
MTWYYLFFTLLVLSTYIASVIVVVRRRHQTVQCHTPLLKIRERNQLEAEAIDVLYERIRIDAAYRRQFVAQCLRAPSVSKTTEDTTDFNDVPAERLERFVVYAVRNLDDRALMKLTEVLRIPLQSQQLVERHRVYELTFPCCGLHQRIAIGLSLACLFFMFLMPPWERRHECLTHVLNGGRTRELIDARPVAYDWIWSEQEATIIGSNERYDLKTSVRHIYRTAVNYVQLGWQYVGLIVLSLCLIWNARKSPDNLLPDEMAPRPAFRLSGLR